jgi:hypothetical protein
VKATLDPSENSRIEEENGATPGEKVSFEHGRPSNGSKGKSNIETEYRVSALSHLNLYRDLSVIVTSFRTIFV